MEEFRDCRGVPGEPSMYEILSMHQGYDDIERVKQFPVVYKRAIELGILTGEE